MVIKKKIQKNNTSYMKPVYVNMHKDAIPPIMTSKAMDTLKHQNI